MLNVNLSKNKTKKKFHPNVVEKNEAYILCHILRKKDDSIANLWNSTIEGKRPVGRPRSRWKDHVRRIKKDISLANNRKE